MQSTIHYLPPASVDPDLRHRDTKRCCQSCCTKEAIGQRVNCRFFDKSLRLWFGASERGTSIYVIWADLLSARSVQQSVRRVAGPAGCRYLSSALLGWAAGEVQPAVAAQPAG